MTPLKTACWKTGLEGIKVHDIHDSFASRTFALGESLPAVGKLLDSRVKTTVLYANLGRETVRISDSIAAIHPAEVFSDRSPVTGWPQDAIRYE